MVICILKFNYMIIIIQLYATERNNFCCLLITFANSLDPDQDRQKQFDTLIAFLKVFFKKVDFEK